MGNSCMRRSGGKPNREEWPPLSSPLFRRGTTTAAGLTVSRIWHFQACKAVEQHYALLCEAAVSGTANDFLRAARQRPEDIAPGALGGAFSRALRRIPSASVAEVRYISSALTPPKIVHGAPAIAFTVPAPTLSPPPLAQSMMLNRRPWLLQLGMGHLTLALQPGAWPLSWTSAHGPAGLFRFCPRSPHMRERHALRSAGGLLASALSGST